MGREYSTAGEPCRKSCKKRQKKLSEAAVYNTKLYTKWRSKYPVKASWKLSNALFVLFVHGNLVMLIRVKLI